MALPDSSFARTGSQRKHEAEDNGNEENDPHPSGRFYCLCLISEQPKKGMPSSGNMITGRQWISRHVREIYVGSS